MNDILTKRVGYFTKQIKTIDQFLDFLDSMIKAPLQVIFTTSLKLSTEDLTHFYPTELKNNLTSIKEGNTGQMGTIRGKFALSIRQNLVHGTSGNTIEEKVEMEIIYILLTQGVI